MKKSLLVILSASILAACGNQADEAAPKEKSTISTADTYAAAASDDNLNIIQTSTRHSETGMQNTNRNADYKQQSSQVDVTQLPEYSILEDHVNLADYSIVITENNPYKRVLLLKNSRGQAEYKSILVKNTGRLKIVDFDGGLVYSGIIQ
ncbi:hypothetical protein [Bacillus sp. B-jedd]|uniref:hypothetical protein n=1 Tax=Bacillus sp. B-jedd TaxID=1476857 RepID=UPI00051566AF|nr:hypothetical protein [Bacillus sp. B-jedd]CEG29362.1 hypothetical protein BN1002_04300 [Bacillus sp. B-jedd]